MGKPGVLTHEQAAPSSCHCQNDFQVLIFFLAHIYLSLKPISSKQIPIYLLVYMGKVGELTCVARTTRLRPPRLHSKTKDWTWLGGTLCWSVNKDMQILRALFQY